MRVHVVQSVLRERKFRRAKRPTASAASATASDSGTDAAKPNPFAAISLVAPTTTGNPLYLIHI